MAIRRRTTAIATAVAVAVIAGGAATAAHATGNFSSIFGQEQCVLSAVELPNVEGLTVSVEGGQVVDSSQAERIADAEAALAEAYQAWRGAASSEFDLLGRLQAAWETLQADDAFVEAEAALPGLNRALAEALAAVESAAAADPAIQASEALREAIDAAPWAAAAEAGSEIVVEMDHLLHDAEGERVWEDLTEEEREFSLTQTHALGEPGATITGLVELDEDDVPRIRITAPDSEGVWVLTAPGRTDGGYLIHSGWAGESSLRWHRDWLETQEVSAEYTEAVEASVSAQAALGEQVDVWEQRQEELGYTAVRQEVGQAFAQYASEGSLPALAAPQEYAAYRQALVDYLDALGADGGAVLAEADQAASATLENEHGQPLSINQGWGGQTPHATFMEHVTAAIDRAQLEAGSTDGDDLALLTCGSEAAVITLTAPGVDAIEVTVSKDGVTGPADVSTVEGDVAALAWGSGITTLPAMAQTVKVDVPEKPEVPEEPTPETPRTPERPTPVTVTPPVPSN